MDDFKDQLLKALEKIKNNSSGSEVCNLLNDIQVTISNTSPESLSIFRKSVTFAESIKPQYRIDYNSLEKESPKIEPIINITRKIG